MKLIILYALIAHVIADFYLQNNRLIELKKEIKGQLIHGLLHLIVMLPILFLQMKLKIFIAILLITTVHVIIDIVKSKLKFKAPFILVIFLLDQAIHIISLIIVMTQVVKYAAPYDIEMYSILLKILVVLLLLKPIDILIEMVFTTIHLKQEPSSQSSSRWIGYIERILFSALIILDMQMFVAVFIGVKTASRWSEVQSNKQFGLQYYIGTFISVLAGLIAGTLFITL